MDERVLRKAVESEIIKAVSEKTGKKVVPVAVSARHIHLCREHVEKLFGVGFELEPIKDLSQPEQFASAQRLTIKTEKDSIKNVRVLGPERPETQVEISVTDAFKLGIEPVLKMSGDLEDTPGCTLISDTGCVDIPRGVMIAKRHLHISTQQAIDYGLKDGQEISISYGGDRSVLFGDVVVRAGQAHELELHIDTDEANAAFLKSPAYGTITE